MIAINYIELIEQGVDAWNHWRSEHPEQHPELESAYLFEKSLQGINLRDANLSRACLIGANLEGADLTGANLSGVYASNANLQRANLTGADLRDSNFIEADLSQAELSDAAIENANFTNARLQETCLDGWQAAVKAPEAVAEAPEAAVAPEPAAAPEPATKTPEAAPSPQPKPVVQPQRRLSTPQMAMIGGAIALAGLYLIFRPRPENFVAPDGTVTIQLVCRESEITPLSVDDPDHTYQNGIRFYGSFEGGKPANGRGSMLYPNGNRYDGQYRDGKRNGCGTFTFNNGRRYVGEFQNDLFSGRGMWLLENGDRYIGDFEFNKCNGEGVYVFADGTSQSGIWQQGRLVDGGITCDRHPIELPDS
ncbi:MAG: pentapeptide repeat-containing protein [Leptolyngbyaceae cyanobacterium]